MLVVGIGGTLRSGSGSEAALRLALEEVSRHGIETQCFAGEQLRLPLFDPRDNSRCERTLALVQALRRADGLVLSSPGYHGSISGLLKNALDYTEDMAGDARVYFDGMPVGCIALAAGLQAANTTVATLRAITHALRGWPTPYGGTVQARPGLFTPDGHCVDAGVEAQLRLVGEQVAYFVKHRHAFGHPPLDLPAPMSAAGA